MKPMKNPVKKMTKRGRPAVTKEETLTVSIDRFPRSVYPHLQALAVADGRTVSGLLRHLVLKMVVDATPELAALSQPVVELSLSADARPQDPA